MALALPTLLVLVAAMPAPPPGGGVARVVLSRHSGETLLEDGRARTRVPLGTALAPFESASGRWEPVLGALGLRSGELSPLALAQAHRLRAEVETLRVGQGVEPAGGAVRFDGSAASARWVVAVDRDRVFVLASATRGADLERGLRALTAWATGEPGDRAVEVQVLGLLPPQTVEARCPGVGARATPSGPVLQGAGGVESRKKSDTRAFTPLRELAGDGTALCLGGAWRVRFPGLNPESRAYAGAFRLCSPPPYQPPAGVPTTPSALKARRGSDFLFRTRLVRYVEGVLDAEDPTVRGAAREALSRVIAHNAFEPRHPGRPLCDTTHCQAFRGTVPSRGVGPSLAAVPYPGWLTFSQGGRERWSAVRTDGRLAALLGAGADLDAVLRAPARCERLRAGLGLPSCPEEARRAPDGVRFFGRGRGHGEGLDVEAAKASRASADALLERAYRRRDD